MHDESWSKLEESLNAGTIIKGYITGKVRGGMTVEVGGVRAFLPGSLVDTRPLESFDHLEKSFQEFKVIKLDKEKSTFERNINELQNKASNEPNYNTDKCDLMKYYDYISQSDNVSQKQRKKLNV